MDSKGQGFCLRNSTGIFFLIFFWVHGFQGAEDLFEELNQMVINFFYNFFGCMGSKGQRICLRNSIKW
jgi:hypothetical protein